MVVVAIVVAGRDKGQAAAIGCPGRLGVVPIAIGELAGRTGDDIDDKQVATAIINKTLPIGAILEPGDQPRRGRLRLVLLAPIILVTHTHHGDQSRAVRRPHGCASALGDSAELACFATGDVYDVDLRLATLAIGQKGQACAIGSPARCAVLTRAAGEAPGWGRTISRPQPDGRAIVVGLLVQTRDRKGYQAPIGREARIRYPLNVEQVRRNHAASHTRLLLMATSSPQPCLTQPVKKAL